MVLNSVYGGRSSKLLTVCYFESSEKIIKKWYVVPPTIRSLEGRQYQEPNSSGWLC